VFVHDTTPPRIQTIAVDDSVSATVTFSQKLDPRQRLTPGDVRLRLLPDSVPVTVASILPGPVDDSLHRRTTGRDSTLSIDSLTADTTRKAPRRKPAPAQPGRPATPPPAPTRPPLYDRLILRVPRPWSAGSRLVLEVRGVKNITGVPGNPVGVVAVPEKKPETAPADSLRRSGRPTPTPPRR
jgi:hypothetical protein